MYEQASISDIADVVTGKTPSTKDFGLWEPDIPFITPKDLQTTKHIATTDRHVSNAVKDRYSKQVVPAGSVCVSCIGNLGYVGVTEVTSLTNQQINTIVPNDPCDSDYLYYVMRWLWPYFKHLEGQSTTLSIINKSQFKRTSIPWPNQRLRQRISDILNRFDDMIELNLRTNDYLAELGKMIWAQTAKQAAKTVKIAEVAADIVTGKTPSTKKPDNYGEEYPFITIPDMHSAVWLCSTERCLSEVGNSSQPKKLVQRGSVLVSCIATVGLVGIVQKPSHFNQQINAVIPANEGDEFYLYYAMHSIKQELLGIGATGSATLNVNKGAFSNIEIPWPERSAMDTYVRTVEPLFKAIEANTLESLRLQELRDTLLPKLMSGEIDVSKVEI